MNRKRLRLENYDYSGNGAYFITICTKNKENIFVQPVGNGHARSSVGMIAEQHLLAIPAHFQGVTIDKYVIMPNHIHVILVLEQPHTERACPFPTVSTVIGSYKSSVSRAAGFPVWQKSFYDHVIRNEADYLTIWQYIENNPLKWELDRFYCADLPT